MQQKKPMPHANAQRGIRNSLLESAGKLFLRKGFLKTSMREIARDAGVGLANIYNYFSSKDEIFRTVVQPVTLAFEQMAHSHHDSGGTDVWRCMRNRTCGKSPTNTSR